MLLFLCCIWACSPIRMYQQNLYKNLQKYDFEHHVYESDGTTLSYWVKNTGSKTPVVLIHGFGGSAAWTWSKSLATISNDRPVLLPDLLWFGESSSTLSPSLSVQAEQLQAVLDTQNWTNFDVVGTSYGGFVSLELSLRVPERVSTVVLVDSPGPVFSLADVDALNKRFSMSHPADLFVPKKPEDVQELLDICMYKRKIRVPKGILQDIWKETSFSLHHNEKELLLENLIASQARYAAQEIRVDYVIWGEFDQIFPLSEAHELVEKTQAHLDVIPNTAHCPFVEEPKKFQQLLLPILDRYR